MVQEEQVVRFSADAVNQTLEAAQAHVARFRPAAINHETALADGSLKLLVECVTVTVHNGRVCADLPLGLGHQCLPIPSWLPSGAAAQACLRLCTTWGIPCGAELTVSAAGKVVAEQRFGCSC